MVVSIHERGLTNRFCFHPRVTTKCGSSDVLSENMETNQNGLDNECNDNERATLKKMVDELQESLKKRKDAIDCLENEKDLLEKEKLLKETEIKVCIWKGRRK